MAGLSLALALGAFCLLGADSTSPNYATLKGQMQVLEAVIDKTMEQTFERPFGLLERAKGSYLPAFGVVFNLQVNLYPVRVPNPFDPRPLSEEEVRKARAVKLDRIETIKRTVPRLLADHAASLRELDPGDTVAVIVHLFHFQAEGEKLPTQLVLQVKKAELELYQERNLSFDELVGKMNVFAL
jgi:hypothetical protein